MKLCSQPADLLGCWGPTAFPPVPEATGKFLIYILPFLPTTTFRWLLFSKSEATLERIHFILLEAQIVRKGFLD